MLRRSAAPASLTLLSLRVYAVGRKKKDLNPPVLADELSVYAVPSMESRFVEEPRSSLEEAICRLRKAVLPYAWWLQAAYSQTRPRVDGAMLRGPAGCDYLGSSPPEALRRLGMIGVPGLLGYLLAGRSRIKRLLYPLGLMALTSSFYYPQDACRAAAVGGEALWGWGAAGLRRLRAAWEAYVQEGAESETTPDRPGRR